MLSTERDFKRGGERLPIPSQGEVEGKLLMFEAVAVTCLQELLAKTESRLVPRLRRRLIRNLKERCAPLKLCTDDEKAAEEFALQLLNAALEEAEDEGAG
ncbi:hypothetical protein HJB79_11505 [Rhizobium lentis]|uniref:hypothetical protein n=1 Tax=Rhizobium lentis TaxID=1138194 RepID=UPI001C83FFB7|nr:hypothetical protein [Rhizobium lentis]MBX5132970.1 hypothetical protein [Rhizobium lentis]MBX5139383.1 hypothetical protein [Rhizobium lentis]MBX5151442.1 hypothetical protein [Rhizobium lentis]MBX5176631.1 hypothetical protein [Rhizobium lentis]